MTTMVVSESLIHCTNRNESYSPQLTGNRSQKRTNRSALALLLATSSELICN